MHTNTPKRLLAALVLLPNLASAQADFVFWDFKEWRQISPRGNVYLGGFTDVFFSDGSGTLSGCFHPSPFIISPNLFCPLGTTAFIAQGDIDFDGVNDQGSFWSVATLTPASVVEPFRPDQFKIISAPPSGIADMLRASNGDVSEIFDVVDSSLVVWYNVLTPPIDDYKITLLQGRRDYGPGRGELDRHYRDVTWGTYQFTLPELNSPIEPPRPVVFAVKHLPTPEAYPGRAAVPSGWHLTNTNWRQGELQVDPRTFFSFQWTGLDPQTTLLTDTLFASMRANQYLDPAGLPHTQYPPDLLISGTITGVDCETIETNLNLDALLVAGSTYEMRITSGDLNGTTQYPIDQIGTAAGLAANEFQSATDISGGVVSGRITGAAGLTLTTNRDLAACLIAGTAFELEFTTGALVGTKQFPITTWGVPTAQDFTTLVDVSGTVAIGDEFVLTPRDQGLPSTVQLVAGHFVQGDRDLTPLPVGGDYRIVITSGALAGQTMQVRNFGFPDNTWFETAEDLSGSLMAGDSYQFREFKPPTNRIKIGDTFSITQTFRDWLLDKFAAGELLAVDAFTLEFVYNIIATPELEVAPALFAVARENPIVYPPYPIETPTFDRQPFLLETFQQEYELGPFFFQPGDSVVGRLNLERSVSAGFRTTENVDRILNYRVQFIDTYEGFALLGGLAGPGFPFGTPASQRAPDFDFDRDGASNLLEFALRTNVADPTSKPTFQYVGGPAPGACTATITKRPFVGDSLIYYFEYSTNLANWTTILPGDPNFEIVVDNATTLTVSNVNLLPPGIPPSCFLRVRVEL